MFQFHQKTQSAQSDTRRGADGIRECDRSILAAFQARYEVSHTDAVRCALRAARDPNFPVTMTNLQRYVGNQDWGRGQED